MAPYHGDLTTLKLADDPRLLAAFMQGYRTAYTTAAALGMVALAFSLVGRARTTVGMEDRG